jgi:predicted nucleic acid-binding protein
MIGPAYEALLGVVDEVLPIDLADVEAARDLVLGLDGLSARDALHVAVMRKHGVDAILSFDQDFDRVPGVRRLSA